MTTPLLGMIGNQSIFKSENVSLDIHFGGMCIGGETGGGGGGQGGPHFFIPLIPK